MKVDPQMLSLMAGVTFLTHFALVHRLKLSITHMEGGGKAISGCGIWSFRAGIFGICTHVLGSGMRDLSHFELGFRDLIKTLF